MLSHSKLFSQNLNFDTPIQEASSTLDEKKLYYYFIPFVEPPTKREIGMVDMKICYLTVETYSEALLSSEAEEECFQKYWRELANIGYSQIINHFPKLILSIFKENVSTLSIEIEDIMNRIEDGDYQPSIQLCGNTVEDILEMIYFYQHKVPIDKSHRTINNLMNDNQVKQFLQDEFIDTKIFQNLDRIRKIRNKYSHSIVQVDPTEYEAIEIYNKSKMILDLFKAWLSEKRYV